MVSATQARLSLLDKLLPLMTLICGYTAALAPAATTTPRRRCCCSRRSCASSAGLGGCSLHRSMRSTTADREQRDDRRPTTTPRPTAVGQGWEIAVAAIGGALLGLGSGRPVGLGLASALFGRRLGLAARHRHHRARHRRAVRPGTPARVSPRAARLVAAPGAVYRCVAGCELVVIVAAIVGGVMVARYRRPNDARGGMATRGEAEQVLGHQQTARRQARSSAPTSTGRDAIGRRSG